MRLLRVYIRGLLIEATEYDEQFGRLLDSDTPEQAIELAASMGIPAKELPWTYLRFRRLAGERWSYPDAGDMDYDDVITKMLKEFGLSEDDYDELYKKQKLPDSHLPQKDLRLRPGTGGGY